MQSLLWLRAVIIVLLGFCFLLLPPERNINSTFSWSLTILSGHLNVIS